MALTDAQLRLVEAIRDLDPKGELVKVDADALKVSYARDIRAPSPTRELTAEELVRAHLVARLATEFDYAPKMLELEHTKKVGRATKVGSLRCDLLLGTAGEPFVAFEAKSEKEYEKEMDSAIQTQLFNAAPVLDPKGETIRYLVYYTVYVPEGGNATEKLVVIDYTKHRSWEDWTEAGRPNLMAIPKNYGIVRKPVFIRAGSPDLRRDVTIDELDRLHGDLHDILWGGGKYQTELFFNLMSIFLAKMYDEKETAEGEPYQFQIFFENGEPEAADGVYERVNTLYKQALKRYLGQSDDEVEKTNDIVFDAPKVKYVIETLQEISLTANRYDLLGLFFERIVRAEFKQTKGQYLTHTNIVGFLVRALRLDELAVQLVNDELRLPYVIDPACGSGTFLIETMKFITGHITSSKARLRSSQSVREFLADMFPEVRSNRWAQDFIYGIEIHRDLATSTKVNMVGHGDGSANIEAKDALLQFQEYTKPMLQIARKSDVYPKPINEQFDVVLSNPPFSIRADRDTAKRLPDNFLWGERIAKALGKQRTKNEVDIEHIFIERWYQLLRPGGRLGVVLPESVLDATDTKYVRLFLYKYFWVRAVISLPYVAFQPYTSTKTSLLLAQKKSSDEVAEFEDLWSEHEKKYVRGKARLDKASARKLPPRPDFVDMLNDFRLPGTAAITHEATDDELAGQLRDLRRIDREHWIFARVTEQLDEEILMAHVDEIGYKRTARGERHRPNELFKQDAEGNIVVDDREPRSVLDLCAAWVRWT